MFKASVGGVLIAAAVLLQLSAADVEGFVNYTFRTALVTSSSNVAWLETHRGVVNLWFSDTTEWAPRALTKFIEPYMSIDDLQISEPERCVLFSRGPRVGANIASLAAGTPATQTWKVSLQQDHAPVVLANTSFYSLSDDLSSIIFVADTAVTTIPLADPTRSTALFTVQKGTVAGLTWSASGDLAFVNDRGSHSFIGVLVRGSDRIKWVSPSVDSDTSPSWSPSGKSLAWIRARPWPDAVGYSAWEHVGMRGPQFSVMTAAISPSGAATHIETLYTDGQRGLPVQAFGRRPLIFLNETAVLFTTEAISGWQHMAVATAKGGVHELRAGECQDFDYQIRDGWAYVAHNCDDLDSRSFERVRLSDGQREPIVTLGTHGTAAVVAASASVSDWDARTGAPGGFGLTSSHVVWMQSSWKGPAVLHMAPLTEVSASKAVQHQPDSSGRRVQPVSVTFPSADGLFTLHAQVFYPQSGASHGGVVHTHGGPPRQSFAAFHYDELYAQEFAVNQWLAAAHNLTVMSVNYRLSDGYGADFRNCQNCMDRGAAEYQDVKRAGEVLLGLFSASPAVHRVEKVGLWGLSYGGFNTIQGIARDSHTVWAAGVSHFGMFNWVSTNRYPAGAIRGNLEPLLVSGGFRSLPTGPMPDMATPTWYAKVSENNKMAFESSPVSLVANMTAPLLLVASDADEDNSFEETIGAVRGMRAHGLEPELLIVPDEVHGLGLYENQVGAYEATVEFLKRYVS